MNALSDFAIAGKWPAKDPSIIQLYSFPTPNGVKVSIALEEMGLAYEAHTVTLSDKDVNSCPSILTTKSPQLLIQTALTARWVFLSPVQFCCI